MDFPDKVLAVDVRFSELCIPFDPSLSFPPSDIPWWAYVMVSLFIMSRDGYTTTATEETIQLNSNFWQRQICLRVWWWQVGYAIARLMYVNPISKQHKLFWTVGDNKLFWATQLFSLSNLATQFSYQL